MNVKELKEIIKDAQDETEIILSVFGCFKYKDTGPNNDLEHTLTKVKGKPLIVFSSNKVFNTNKLNLVELKKLKKLLKKILT